jgi:hypothetical protein
LWTMCCTTFLGMMYILSNETYLVIFTVHCNKSLGSNNPYVTVISRQLNLILRICSFTFCSSYPPEKQSLRLW